MSGCLDCVICFVCFVICMVLLLGCCGVECSVLVFRLLVGGLLRLLVIVLSVVGWFEFGILCAFMVIALFGFYD